MSDDRDIFYAFLGLVSGIVWFFVGFKCFRKKQLIDNIPTSTVRGMAMGLVELNGRAGRDSYLKGPLSREDSVAYTYLIQRYEQRGKSSSWVTIRSGDSFSYSFYLEDDTGKISVVPQGVEFICNATYSFETGFGNPLTPNLVNFMNEAGISYGGFLGDARLRFTERSIKPGEQVYVLGTAKKIVSASLSDAEALQGADVVIGKGDLNKIFIISDKSQKDLDIFFGWQSIGGIFGGAALTIACLWYLLMRFHIY